MVRRLAVAMACFFSLLPAGGANANDPNELEGDRCEAELVVDGARFERCDALVGPPALWQRHRHRRQLRPITLNRGPYSLDVLHAQEPREQPVTLAAPGLRIRQVMRAEVEPSCKALQRSRREERVAVVELTGAWREQCGTSRQVLRVNDAVGSGGRVAAIRRDGVLLSQNGALRWLPVEGATEPSFRMIWRSPDHFRVQSASSATRTPVRRPPVRQPVRRAIRRR